MTHDPLLPEMTGHLIAAMDGDIAPSSLRTLARRLIAQVRADERERAAERVEAAHAGSADENECTESIYAWNLAADAARGGDSC